MMHQSEETTYPAVASSLERLSTQSELNSSRQDMFSSLSLYNSHANVIITMMLAVLTAFGYFLIQDIELELYRGLMFFVVSQLILGFSLASVVVLYQYYDLYVSVLIHAANLHKENRLDRAIIAHPWLRDLDQFDATKNSNGTASSDVTKHKFGKRDCWAIKQLERIPSIIMPSQLRDYVIKNRLDDNTVNHDAAQIALRSRRCVSIKYSLVPYSAMIAVMGIAGSLMPIAIKSKYEHFIAWHSICFGVFGLAFFLYACYAVFQTPAQRLLGLIVCVLMAMWLLGSFVWALI